jgi:hypothetical protein
MTRTAMLLTRLYTWSLRLYPRQYRLDYASELQTVFEMALDEISTTGFKAVLWFGLRELSDLPGALVFQHRRERRNQKMEKELNSSSLSEGLTWKGAFISLVPILLTIVWWVVIIKLINLINTASTQNPPMVVRGILTIFLVFFPVVAGVVRGLAKGTPRWAYLHLGLLISFLGMLLFFGVESASRLYNPHLFDTPSAWTWWLYRVGPWAAFTIISVLFILLARAWRPLRPFYEGLNGDWTLLSFSLSTNIIWFLLLGLNEIPTSFLWPYLLVGILVLFFGVISYLRSSSSSTRIFVLLAALSLAMVVFGIGRSAYWGNLIYGEPRLIFSWETAWNEARATFRDWTALMLLVSAPAFLGLVSLIWEESKPDHTILSA